MSKTEIPKLKMVQDTKILQQIVGQLVKNDNCPTINVINVGQVNDLGNKEESHNDFDFTKFINNLPEPKLESLTKKAIQLALALYPDQISAGKWLGISPRVMSYQNKLLQEVPEK